MKEPRYVASEEDGGWGIWDRAREEYIFTALVGESEAKKVCARFNKQEAEGEVATNKK